MATLKRIYMSIIMRVLMRKFIQKFIFSMVYLLIFCFIWSHYVFIMRISIVNFLIYIFITHSTQNLLQYPFKRHYLRVKIEMVAFIGNLNVNVSVLTLC